MRNTLRFFSAGATAAVLAITLGAEAPARPANATGECKDGTFTTTSAKRGACSGHGGVKTWFAGPAAKKSLKAAGQETKMAAKEAGEAAKSTATAGENVGRAVGTAAKGAVTSRPGNAPKNATAKCKDGSYSHSRHHRRACSKHGGVAEWYK